MILRDTSHKIGLNEMFCKGIFFIISMAYLIPIAALAQPETEQPLVQTPSLSERFIALNLKPERLFYEPQSQLEKVFFLIGWGRWHQRYGESPEDKGYQGFIVRADPFHDGLRRINFLLGSDCSTFAHRIYQILGANYPYASTDTLLHLAEMNRSGLSPKDYWQRQLEHGQSVISNLESFEYLAKSFEVFSFENMAEPQPGDIFVHPHREERGGLRRGHTLLITQSRPVKALMSMNRHDGIVEIHLEEFLGSPEIPIEDGHLLRWKGPLEEMKIKSLDELIETEYPYLPCEKLLGDRLHT